MTNDAEKTPPKRAYARLSPETKQAYIEAGAYLQKLRQDAGLTQLELAQKLGMKYVSSISQVETGQTRVAQERLADWAKAFKSPPKEVAKRLLFYYDRVMWNILFGNEKE